MSSKLPYFRWHPKDFDTDENVRLMSMCEVGLYVLCLNHCWVNGSLPDDLKKISKIVGQPFAQVKKSWPAVSKCFTKNEAGALVNTKQEKERKWAQERRSNSKDAVDIREGIGFNPSPRNTVLPQGEETEKGDRAHGYESDSVSGSSPTQTTNTEKPSTRGRDEIFVDFETLLQRWRHHRGFKKPQKHIAERAEQRWGTVEITEGELIGALDGYFASEWARSQDYPILGFVKDPHSWIGRVEAEEGDDEGFDEFQLAYPGVSIPSDWDKARPIWRGLLGEERAKAKVHVAGCDPAFIKSPRNYLRDKEFLRPPRPEPKSASQKLLDMA